MVTFAYGCAHAFFFMNGMTCVCVCACPGPSAVFVDYKVMRISREKTEHTDYTTALVQPKALHCSPGSSDQLMRGDSVWRKVLRPGWWNVLHGCWKYRKCFILYTNLRCSVEQGYTTTRLDGITPQSSADLSLYRFVAHNAHTHTPVAVRCNRRKWVSNTPCSPFQKHTHVCFVKTLNAFPNQKPLNQVWTLRDLPCCQP